MAINWNAYEAAKELYGNNKENIQDIGSRFPLFSRAVMAINDEALLDILGAIPKVTARVVETGLKDLGENTEAETEDMEEEAPKKTKETKKDKKETKEVDADENDYSLMNAKDLYKLCCERGISSLCKSRSKDALIELLEKFDNGEVEATKGKKKAEPVEEPEEEYWEDEEEEEESDPYAGKSAKELYKLCTDRGIKTKPKQNADVYAKLLKKADEAEEPEPEDEDDDDEWEI